MYSEDKSDNAGLITARIDVDPGPEAGVKKVALLAIEQASGKTIFKATYKTKQRGDFAAYNSARELLDQVAKLNGMTVDEVDSNADLPQIKMSTRRWR
ncbi:hypothetical protein [Thalassobacillus devorans]|uniref:hypothetical protein n=1 Tax=Thalassobacillus devorans TaxID=279813 RepID=UPI000A1CC6E8|nr:hypothetical protein [Thalassobacillus devorans]